MSCQSIKDVLSTLEVLSGTVSLEDSKQNLKILLKSISDAIDEVAHYRKKPELQCFSNKMKLCSIEVGKALPSLVKLLFAGTDPALMDITHYLVEKLHWCFSEILRIIEGGGEQDDSEPSGLFIKSVDNLTTFCLNGEKSDPSLKMLVEDLLCHALTIAKISDIEDYHEIAAACRNILTNTSGASTIADIEKEPLKKDALLCSIAILERKVNIAVLRLYLNVSCKFLPPLKNIVKKASNHQRDSIKTRQPDDIQFEVNVLDQYFERVQLIGNYAVACTDCKKKKLRVQCSLTSLEFLANYIIPAATTFYIDPTNLVKKRFLQFLTDESLDELKGLTNLLDYNIVDTAAFVQVLHEDVVDVVFTIKEKFYSGTYCSLDSNELTSKCYKLVNHLKTTNDPLINGNQIVTDIAKQLLSAVKDHGEQTRDTKALLNRKLFCSKLDFIVAKIEELALHLNDKTLNVSQTTLGVPDTIHRPKKMEVDRNLTSFTNHPKKNNSVNKVQIKNQSAAITSTPIAVCTKKTGNVCTTYKMYSTPVTPNNNLISLDPYLTKIRETPLLRSAVHVKTPYTSIYEKKPLPKHLSFDNCDAEDNAASKFSPATVLAAGGDKISSKI